MKELLGSLQISDPFEPPVLSSPPFRGIGEDEGRDPFVPQGLAKALPAPIPLPEDAYPLIVDDREPHGQKTGEVSILDILAAHHPKVPVKVARLDHADYLAGGVWVTRKTEQDLLNSMSSHHVEDELARLLLTETKVAMIVETSRHIKWEDAGRVKDWIFWTNQAIPITRSENLEDTANMLVKFRARFLAGRWAGIRRQPVIFGSPSAVVTHYASMPGIGAEMAERIAKVFPYPLELALAIAFTGQRNRPKILDEWIAKWSERIWRAPKKRTAGVPRWEDARWDALIEGIGNGRNEALTAFYYDGEASQIELGKP